MPFLKRKIIFFCLVGFQENMINFSCYHKTMQRLLYSLFLNIVCLSKSICYLTLFCFRFILLRATPFWTELCYFLSLSCLGFWFLKVSKPRTNSFEPRNLDLFFTSVSATTVSSMSTVEMEAFSNSQLVIITLLMFLGGEVFVSMAGLFLRISNIKQLQKVSCSCPQDPVEAIETGVIRNHHPSQNYLENPIHIVETDFYPSHNCLENPFGTIQIGVIRNPDPSQKSTDLSNIEHYDYDNHYRQNLMYNSMLGFIVLGYLLVINGLGIALVYLYVFLVSTANGVLKSKGLNPFTFSVFITISSFASCGFIPTNENMAIFRKNSGLLLILIPQILLGNTLFPSCLRFSIWVLMKLVKKFESELKFLLKNTKEIGYLHLLPRWHSSYLVGTVFGFIVVQVLMFWFMEWNSEGLMGMNTWQKMVGVLFLSVNTRHTGETIMDLSIISPAILVMIVFMMYLPLHTSFTWIKREEKYEGSKRREKVVDNLLFSHLTYIVIFVILICITERQKMREDPLNFNVLNIVLEVVSAYGNVGFTMGYSCKRQITADSNCVDKWYGFVGKWSDQGKIILIAVMIYGRLKKFNMRGGKAWKLQHARR